MNLFKTLAVFIAVSLITNYTKAQTFNAGEVNLYSGINYSKSGHNNAGLIKEGKVYSYDDGKVVVSNQKTGAKEKEINVKKPFKSKSGTTVSGNIYSDGKGGAFIIYDLGGAGGLSVWNKNTNNFDNVAFLIAQKYDENWQPIGNAVNLMAEEFKNNRKLYSAGVFFNPEKSKFTVVQSLAYQVSHSYVLSFQKMPLLATVYDLQLNKLKEINLTQAVLNKQKQKSGLFKVRDVSFAQNKLSVLIAFTEHRSKANDEVAEHLKYDFSNGKLTSKNIQISFASKSEKVHYARFLPEQHDKLILFLKDFNTKFEFATASKVKLVDISGEKMKVLSEWKQPASKVNATETNALCINDMDGKSKVSVFKTTTGKYILVATRDFIFCSCDRKGNKKWQYFFVMTIDKNNKIKQEIIPIAKQKNFKEYLPIKYYFKDDKLFVYSTFSLSYYKEGNTTIDPKTKEQGTKSVLEIDENLKTNFYEIK